MTPRVVWLTALLISLTSAAAGALIANFDSFPEGDTENILTDGGITFSPIGLNQLSFVIEATDRSIFNSFLSPPNYLTSSGFVPGPGFSFGPLGPTAITFRNTIGTAASMDVFSLPDFFFASSTLTLQAFLGQQLVGADSVGFNFPINGIVVHQVLSITGVSFDQLRLIASGPVSDGFVDVGLDNVRIDVVPEPGSRSILAAALAFLISGLWKKFRRIPSTT